MTIATVRMLIPDKAQYDRASSVGDGASLEFLMPNKPIMTGSAKVYVSGTLKTLTTEYVIDEALGLVTMVAAPAVGASVIVTYQHAILSDADITAMLALESSSSKRATALALETIAADQTLVLKVITLAGLTTNGAAVATSLLARAKLLREQADVEESSEEGGSFDVIEMIPTDFAYRERVWNEALRTL